MPVQGLGSVFPGGLSVVTDGNSAVSAYGPRIGRDVAVIALTVNSGQTTTVATTSTDTTFAVTGAAVGDPVLVAAPSGVSAGLLWNAFVPSAGNVTLRFANGSAATISQTAQTWGVEILRRSFVTRIA